MAQLTGTQYARLRDLIVDAFNPESLFQLVRFEMGVDMYKEYVPTGKPFAESVRIFIGALEERGTTVSLLDCVLAARPDKPAIQAELPAIRTALASPVAASSEQVMVVEKALMTAAKAADVGHGTVPTGSSEFLEKLRSDLDLIQIYKTLHDCLHKAQMHLGPLEIEARAIGAVGQEDAVDRFSVSFDVFIMEGMNARRSAAKLPPEPTFLLETEENWLQQFDSAITLGKQGLDKGDGSAARLATKRFRSILRREPSRIDGILRSCTGSLDLEGLRKLLEDVSVASGSRADTAVIFSEGCQAAEHLFRKLKAMVNQHNQWQGIDLALWEAEEQLPAPTDTDVAGGDFELLWNDLNSSLQLLVDSAPSSDWAVGLMAQKAKADAAWQTQAWKDFARCFRQFRKICLMNFFAIDSELKGLADQVARLRESLNQLLHKLTS